MRSWMYDSRHGFSASTGPWPLLYSPVSGLHGRHGKAGGSDAHAAGGGQLVVFHAPNTFDLGLIPVAPNRKSCRYSLISGGYDYPKGLSQCRKTSPSLLTLFRMKEQVSPLHGYRGDRHLANPPFLPAGVTVAISREAGSRGTSITKRAGRPNSAGRSTPRKCWSTSRRKRRVVREEINGNLSLRPRWHWVEGTSGTFTSQLPMPNFLDMGRWANLWRSPPRVKFS